MGLRKCPNCGSTKFKARLIYGAIVESQKDGTFKILEQGKQYAAEPFECTCGASFNDWNSQLVNEAAVCIVCGNESDTVDESGKCEICRFYEKYPTLKNIPTEDLVKYFIHQQMHQKAQSHAVPAAETVQETPAETAPASAGEPAPAITETAKNKVDSAQQAVEEAKKSTAKRKPRKKKDTQAAEQPQAVPEENAQPKPAPADGGQPVQQQEQQNDGSWVDGAGLGLPSDAQDTNPFTNGDMSSLFNPDFSDAGEQQANDAMAEMFGTPTDGQQAF